jgi:glucose/arabinose dehydrogenase
VISDDFPITSKAHPGYNAQGTIHFGPDKMLYLSIGDYDDPVLVQDLSTPVGKLLRIDPATGEAAPDNPLAGDPEADPRIYAWGFRTLTSHSIQHRGHLGPTTRRTPAKN